MAMNGMQAAALGAGYLDCQINAVNAAPRPLGFVERASGLANGLEGLERRLESLIARVDGNGEIKGNQATVAMPGLGSQLSEAEQHLRTCMSLIDELHNRF